MVHLNSQKTALIVSATNSFITAFMATAMNIALPAIGKEFSLNAVQLSWIATSYLLASSVFLVPMGKAADIYGRKKIFNLGILIFTLSSLLLAFVQSFYMLILLRIIQGTGASMIMATGIAILSSLFPPSERGSAIGIVVATVYTGCSAGPSIGGLIVHHLDWRSIFLIISPPGFLSLLFAIRYIKGEWADAKGEKLNITGSLVYAVAIISLVYGATILPDKKGFALILLGITGLLSFIKLQSTVKYPVFQVKLFRGNRVFTFSSLAALINYSATYGVTFLLSLYLQYIKGMTPKDAGLVLIAQPLMQAIFSPYAGKLSDKVEPGIIASAGMALTALGLLMLIFTGLNTGLIFIVITLALLGLGFALFSSPNMNAIMGSVEKKYYGLASGTVATMRLLGQMLSMAVTTVIFALLIGKARIEPSMYPLFLKTIKIAFSIFAALCIVGIYFSFTRGTLHKEAKIMEDVKDDAIYHGSDLPECP